MTKEDKELLLKDLIARLPYGVKCYPVITNGEPNTIGGYCEVLDDFYIREIGGWFSISMIKPYLRPMSSMTEEECKTLGNIPATLENNLIEILPNIPYYIEVAVPDQIDWLNAHHFDYRGLIEKGLALEASKNMYKI